jgi:hypothetical protein
MDGNSSDVTGMPVVLIGKNHWERRAFRSKMRAAYKRNLIPPPVSSSGLLAAAIEQQTPDALYKPGQSVLWFWASWFLKGDV